MIETILKTVEAEAGMPKMPFVFSTPIATAAKAKIVITPVDATPSITLRAKNRSGSVTWRW